MIGPLNATKPVAFATGLVPLAARAAEAEAAEAEEEKGNPIERLLGSLATPAEEEEAAGGLFPDDASEEERGERRRMAEWSTEGGAWRGAATSLLFTFAVLNAARGKWQSYPLDRAALEAVGRGDGSQATAQTLSPAGMPADIREELEAIDALPSVAKPAADAAPPVALAGDSPGATAGAAPTAPTSPTTAGARAESTEAVASETVDLAARQQEIDARLAQIDDQLKEKPDPAAR